MSNNSVKWICILFNRYLTLYTQYKSICVLNWQWNYVSHKFIMFFSSNFINNFHPSRVFKKTCIQLTIIITTTNPKFSATLENKNIKAMYVCTIVLFSVYHNFVSIATYTYIGERSPIPTHTVGPKIKLFSEFNVLL